MHEPSPSWPDRFSSSLILGIQLFLVVAGSSLAWAMPHASARWLDLSVLAICLFVLSVADFRLPQGEIVHVALPMAAAGLAFSHEGYVLLIMAAILFATYAPRTPSGHGTAVLYRTIGPVAALSLGVLSAEVFRVLPLHFRAFGGPLTVAVVVLAGTVLSALECSNRLEQRPLITLAGSIRLQKLFLPAEVSVGILVVLLAKPMGLWSLLLTMLVLLVIRQSFALLVEVKVSYRLTMEALAKAMEAQAGADDGHGARVSRIAALAARQLRLPASTVEQIGYAALLHDLAILEASQESCATKAIAGVDQLFGDVDFLRPVLPVLRLFESPECIDATGPDGERHLETAYLIARASAIDSGSSVGHGRDQEVAATISQLLPYSRIGAIERATIAARDRIGREAC